jgi:hypothetical protein
MRDVTFIRINLQQNFSLKSNKKFWKGHVREREREADAQTFPVFYSLYVNLILFV